MNDDAKKDLKKVISELKEIWLQYQNEIRNIEENNPKFHKKYEVKDEYTQYVLKKGFYSGISLAHGKLEEFFNKHSKDWGELMWK